jgi:aspartate carbamoyltransferase
MSTTHHDNYDDVKLATLTEDPSSWKGASLLSVTQLTARGLQLLLRLSQEMCQLVTKEGGGGDDRLRHCVLATVFYEASTRTACSFQAAMQRLGGSHIHVDGSPGANTSAGKKGESLEDTIRCLQCYSDVTVLRHPTQGSVGRVIQMTPQKPILNAGDGIGEHPTQALLDVYTIYNELKLYETKRDRESQDPSCRRNSLPPLTVVLLGDLKHGRTVHSLVKLLATASTSRGILWDEQLVLRYCSPEALQMPRGIQEYCTEHGDHRVIQETYTDLGQACQGANVLYVTRVQRERFATEQDYQACHASSYVVNAEMMKNCNAPADMIVLHPLPRVDEIDTNVDDDPRAAYFRQMANGMYVRMAILALVLGKATSSSCSP